MTTGLLATSFALGLRHGFDWDHIAAIADLNSTADGRRRGFLLSLYYALGHALVVFALGTLLIIVGASIPASLDEWMGRIVGATLVGLGIAVLWDLRRNGGSVQLRSRWMLVLDGTFAGLRRVRRSRDRRTISIEHSHEHEHDAGMDHDTVAAHDHTHVLTEDQAATLVTAGETRAGRVRSGRWWRPHRHAHVHHADLPVNRLSADGGVAAGVGMLHGIGIESPTQIAIFVASTSVVGTANGLSLLAAWVIGLVVANIALAVAAGTGLTRPDGNRKVFVALALVVAVGSIALGLRYLLA